MDCVWRVRGVGKGDGMKIKRAIKWFLFPSFRRELELQRERTDRQVAFDRIQAAFNAVVSPGPEGDKVKDQLRKELWKQWGI